MLEKTEKSGQLSQEVRKCIQSATTLDDIETLAAQFKTSSQQSLASRARAVPNLEAKAHMYLEPSAQIPAGMFIFNSTQNVKIVPAHFQISKNTYTFFLRVGKGAMHKVCFSISFVWTFIIAPPLVSRINSRQLTAYPSCL